MKKPSNESIMTQSVAQLSRQLELITKLLVVIATDQDFSSHTQEHQIAILGKLGFRNSELANLFAIKPQQVNNAFRKYKEKKY